MLKVLEMFSGYGGGSFALKKAQIPHEIIGHSEIDKFAILCYSQNHSGKCLGNSKEIDPGSLPDFDLLTGGFPCQAFSKAGKRLGFEDTRGTLIFDVLRIANIKKPRFMLLENVEGLVNHNKGDTFTTILESLEEIGYFVKYKILVSKDFGIPQNRRRIYLACFRDKSDFDSFEFPQETNLKLFLRDILEDDVPESYDLSESIKSQLLVPNDEGRLLVRQATKQGWIEAFDGDCVNFTFPNSKTRRGRVNRGIAQTLDTACNQAVYIDGRLRRLTPVECFRLMGFLNDEINLSGLSDTQKWKLAGNGWDINIISLIFKQMLIDLDKNSEIKMLEVAR